MAKHLKHGKSFAEKEYDNQRVKETVESVLKQIEQDGDTAVRALSKKFDNYNPTSFKLTSKQINDLISTLSKQELQEKGFASF